MQINVFMVGFLNPIGHYLDYYETKLGKDSSFGKYSFNHSLIYLVNIH